MREKSRDPPDLFKYAARYEFSPIRLSDILSVWSSAIRTEPRTQEEDGLPNIAINCGHNKLSTPHLTCCVSWGTAWLGFSFPFFAHSHLHSRSWSWPGVGVRLQRPTAQVPAAAPAVADRGVAADRETQVVRDAAVRDLDITTKMAQLPAFGCKAPRQVTIRAVSR
jgi:hypothetical protein